MTFSAPTPEQQIQFLHDLQRIFEEGDFSATYKFALLMALAEIAVTATIPVLRKGLICS
jgi:hypothetical protein